MDGWMEGLNELIECLMMEVFLFRLHFLPSIEC